MAARYRAWRCSLGREVGNRNRIVSLLSGPGRRSIIGSANAEDKGPNAAFSSCSKAAHGDSFARSDYFKVMTEDLQAAGPWRRREFWGAWETIFRRHGSRLILSGVNPRARGASTG